MRPAWSSKLRARGGIWPMLFSAAVGVVGMQILAMLAKGPDDEAWVDAVYRYRADAIPACELLAGPAQRPRAESDMGWARLSGLDTATAADGRCRSQGGVVM